MFRGETWVWRGGRADLVWVPDTETMRWCRGTFSGFYYIVLFTEEAKLTRRQRTSF